MKITEDVVKEREMIISSLEAELTSYKNEVRILFAGVLVRGTRYFLVFTTTGGRHGVSMPGMKLSV